MKPDLLQTIFRSGRLRCPDCGEGKVAKNWRETNEKCPKCGFDFCVEGGFYLGSIYLNYGFLAVVSLTVGMPAVWFGYVTEWVAVTVGLIAFIPMSIWFFRYARSLWLGFGYYIDHTVRDGRRHDLLESESQIRRETDLEPSQESIEAICYFCHRRFSSAKFQPASWIECPICKERIFITRK